MGLLKFIWLKNGPAQILLAQKWACSNLGWLKFGSAQIWSAQIWPLKFGLLKNGLTPRLTASLIVGPFR